MSLNKQIVQLISTDSTAELEQLIDSMSNERLLELEDSTIRQLFFNSKSPRISARAAAIAMALNYDPESPD